MIAVNVSYNARYFAQWVMLKDFYCNMYIQYQGYDRLPWRLFSQVNYSFYSSCFLWLSKKDTSEDFTTTVGNRCFWHTYCHDLLNNETEWQFVRWIYWGQSIYSDTVVTFTRNNTSSYDTHFCRFDHHVLLIGLLLLTTTNISPMLWYGGIVSGKVRTEVQCSPVQSNQIVVSWTCPSGFSVRPNPMTAWCYSYPE